MVITLPPTFQDRVAVIDTFGEGDIPRYLTSQEQARVQEFRSEKRRHEWIASRIALRNLAMQRGMVVDPLSLSIDSDARPPIAFSDTQTSFVSFSHSAHAGAAAMSSRRIGVDLEQLRVVEPRLRKFFLNEEESARADELDLSAGLIHLWAAKEAAFKLVASLTLLKEVELVAWTHDENGMDATFRGGVLRGTIRTAQLNDRFVLALAREE